jgi:biopolymer transport protein ExbD
MGMSAGGSGGVQASPNVTPMIDVMLVILIIFMVVTPALLAGFNAVPPQGVNLKDHPEEETDQVLGIDTDGVYYLNKKPIKYDDIGPAISAIFKGQTRDEYVMYIKADKSISYEKVLDAMDLAAKNGVRVVGMISEQTPGTQSTVAGDAAAPAGGG